MYHTSGGTENTRRKKLPVVLLTRRKDMNIKNGVASKSPATDAPPQHMPQRFDSYAEDHIGSESRESFTAQHCTGSEKHTSPSVSIGVRAINSGFEEPTQSTFPSHPPSLEVKVGPPSLHSRSRAVPEIKAPRRMQPPLEALRIPYNFQADNRPLTIIAHTHEPQSSTFPRSRSTHSPSLTSEDHFSSFYGTRWEPRKPDPGLSGNFPEIEKQERPVVDAPKSSYAGPSSHWGADGPSIIEAPKQSAITGIHRFLSKCRPPMMQHILRFVEFGCTTTEYLRGVSEWPAEQRHRLLVKILQPEWGGAAPQMDIAVLENQFETYFMDDDV